MDWLRVLRDLFRFVVQRRKYVLAPIIVIIMLMAAFVLVAEIPVVTPFIYALF